MEHLEIREQLRYSSDKQTRKKLISSDKLVAELVCYEPGQATVIHLHPGQDELFYVIDGEGTIQAGEEEVRVTATSVVFVPAGTRHGIKADAGNRLALMFVKGPGSTEVSS